MQEKFLFSVTLTEILLKHKNMLECSRNDKKALTNTTVECLKVFKWHIKRKRRQKEEMAHQRGNEKKGKTMHVRSGCVQGDIIHIHVQLIRQ